MVLFILLTIVLRCSSKFSLQSETIPRCFCNANWWTGLSLKINVGWLVLVILLEKPTSYVCLRWSGLKLIFHWYGQLLIFRKSKCVCQLGQGLLLAPYYSTLGFGNNSSVTFGIFYFFLNSSVLQFVYETFLRNHLQFFLSCWGFSW